MTKLHRNPPKILGISKPSNIACIGCAFCFKCVACYKCKELHQSISTSYSSFGVKLKYSKRCSNCYFSSYLKYCQYCYHSINNKRCIACTKIYYSKNCYHCSDSIFLENKMWIRGDLNA